MLNMVRVRSGSVVVRSPVSLPSRMLKSPIKREGGGMRSRVRLMSALEREGGRYTAVSGKLPTVKERE
jgi:hypothetical protein